MVTTRNRSRGGLTSPAKQKGSAEVTKTKRKRTTRKRVENGPGRSNETSCLLCLGSVPTNHATLDSQLSFFRDVKELFVDYDVVDRSEGALCMGCFALAKECDEQFGTFLEKVETCRLVGIFKIEEHSAVLERPSKKRRVDKAEADACNVALTRNRPAEEGDDKKNVAELDADIHEDEAAGWNDHSSESPVSPDIGDEQPVITEDHVEGGTSDMPPSVTLAGGTGMMEEVEGISRAFFPFSPKLIGNRNAFGHEQREELVVDQTDDSHLTTVEQTLTEDGTSIAIAHVHGNAKVGVVSENPAEECGEADGRVDSNAGSALEAPKEFYKVKRSRPRKPRWSSTGVNSKNSASYTEHVEDNEKRGYLVDGFFLKRFRGSNQEPNVDIVQCAYRQWGTCTVWGAVNFAEQKFYYPALVSVRSHNHTESGLDLLRDIKKRKKMQEQRLLLRKAAARGRTKKTPDAEGTNRKNGRPFKNPIVPGDNFDDEKGNGADKPEKRNSKRHLICVQCWQQLGTPRSLFNHYRKFHSIEGGTSCSDCGRSFSTQEELSDHQEEHYRENLDRVSCITCRAVVKEVSFQRHVLFHHEGKVGRTKQEREELGVKVLRCSLDSFWTTSLFAYELHATQNHLSSDKPYFCNECSQTFPSFASLGNHEAEQHTGKPVSRCGVCGETFLNRSSYMQHMRIHRGKDRAKRLCPECGKVLSSLKALRYHMDVYHNPEGVHTYKCPHCEEKFLTFHRRYVHLKSVHNVQAKGNGSARFSCEECGVKSYCTLDYRAHMKQRHDVTLPGLKEYPCSYCDRMLYSGKQLRQHEKLKHGLIFVEFKATGLVCKDCDFASHCRIEFREHLQKFHGVQVALKRLGQFVRKPGTKTESQL